MGRRSFTLAALAATAQPVRAQEAWPARPLKIVVSCAPGSGNDIIARQLAPRLGEALGQSFIVENRAGGGGLIGTESVVRAAPDGYTIGLGTSSQLVMNPALLAKLPFDVERDLAMIGLVSRTQMLLAARRDGPADLRALVARAKAAPGQISYGSGGNGSISHIVGESFARSAGLELLHVPYKGNGPAMQDLAGGQIDLVWDGRSSAAPMMTAGQIRLLAVSGERGNPLSPEVPTFAEGGTRDGYQDRLSRRPTWTPRPPSIARHSPPSSSACSSCARSRSR
jgi:tripartite-type tricarboxylate transporter receptor subunit TctC